MSSNNVTIAAFNSSRKINTSPLYQYDYGQVLQFMGIKDLPMSYEVHFSNNEFGWSKTVLGDADGVLIPDEYLLSGSDIHAWLFLHAGTDDGRTEYQVTIPVRKRAEVTDAQPTPQEQSLITQAMAVLEEAMRETGADARSGAEAAQAAAEQARDTAISAKDDAVDAKDIAVSAKNDAISAANDAINAQTAAETAQGLAETAQTAAETAQGLAETAQGAAETAQGLAETAAETAQTVAESIPSDYTELAADVADTKTALGAVANQPSVIWNLSKGINASGAISDNNYTALTDIIDARGNNYIVYTGQYKDSNNNNFVLNIATYRTVNEKNDTFVERIALSSPITLASNITGFRLHFGRATASGVTIQESDITTYYSINIWQKSAPNIAFEKLVETVNNIITSQPVFNNSVAVFETAKSYLNVSYDPADRLAYAQGIGLFQPNVKNEQNIKCISCSQFVQACLSGIDFAHSRYVIDQNEVAEWGFVSGYYGQGMIDYGDYLTTQEMGAFFDSRGQLRELSKTSPQVKVGDVLIFHDGEKYYHCAICTGVTTSTISFVHAADRGHLLPEGQERIVDGEGAGVFIRSLNWTSRYAPTHYVSINDVITDTIPVTVSRIVYDDKGRTGTYSTTSAYIKSIVNNINTGLYTIKIEDDGTGDSVYYMRIWYYKADGSRPEFFRGRRIF